MPSQPAPVSSPPPSNQWVTYQTAEGAPYYHNASTGETRWDLPTASEPSAQTVAPAGANMAQEQWAQQQWAQQAGTYQEQQWAQQAQQQQHFAAQVQYQYQQAAASQHAAQAAAAQAQQQQDQWAAYYAQYWSWYQSVQEERQAEGVPEPAEELMPPPPGASVQEQLAFAMKGIVLKEMEAMRFDGTSVEDRKKHLKVLQIKWHPDKNPDQEVVAKGVFQLLVEKKEWFLFDPDAQPDLELEVAQVD